MNTEQDQNEAPFAACGRLEQEVRRHEQTLAELLSCCKAWEPDVRILGNVRAQDAAEAIEFFLSLQLGNAV